MNEAIRCPGNIYGQESRASTLARTRQVRRRDFLRCAAGLSLAVSGLPLLSGCTSRSSGNGPKRGVPRLGYLSSSTEALGSVFRDAFLEGLRVIGYADGHNAQVEQRFSGNDPQQLQNAMLELIHSPVDVLFAADTQALTVTGQQTRTVPIVTIFEDEPVGTGLVQSLAHPGGNVTGLTRLSIGESAKRLQLLRATVPSCARAGVFWNANLPGREAAFRETRDAGSTLGIEVVSLAVRAIDDFSAAIEHGRRDQIEAFVLLEDALTLSGSQQISMAYQFNGRLPGICEGLGYARGGGLMAYGTDIADVFRRGAGYVDRILKGTRPADMPVERPTRFTFAINLQAARDLGISVPQSVLVQATEVIQ